MSGSTSVVGVRALRARLSAYLREVAAGGTVTIGDRRGRPVARLSPVRESADLARLLKLAQRGLVQVGSGKPGSQPPVKPRRGRRRVADLVIEDRR
ncbi:MAG: type II toxin-antitoxin system prevent-host-death family antitoxin [bacterium]